VNSLADLVTFVLLWRCGSIHASPFGQAIFRGCWFTENLLTQAVAVLVLRSRTGPSLRSRPAWPVLLGAAGVFAVGVGLPLSPLAPAIGMHAPPVSFFPLLAAVLGGYCAVILAVRTAYLRVSPRWL
jgi:P-type Mg2+ transporter